MVGRGRAAKEERATKEERTTDERASAGAEVWGGRSHASDGDRPPHWGDDTRTSSRLLSNSPYAVTTPDVISESPWTNGERVGAPAASTRTTAAVETSTNPPALTSTGHDVPSADAADE